MDLKLEMALTEKRVEFLKEDVKEDTKKLERMEEQVKENAKIPNNKIEGNKALRLSVGSPEVRNVEMGIVKMDR